MKLTHICFADDLLVLCNGDVASVKVVKKSLDTFSQVSSLLPNINKSTIFFGSVKLITRNNILKVLPFEIGVLPMKYLGVPLLAKRLGIKDCKCLVDRVRKKVSNWKTKKLSYAGRLQLVASVLSAMQTYWASVYVIPYGVVDEIDKLLKGFLWSQSEQSKGKAKVAWKYVCVPKDQGDLGLKPLKEWNEVLIVKQIWRILVKDQSLWSVWVNLVKLKGKSFWDIAPSQSDRWGWKFLLKLRDKIKHHIGSEFVNGRLLFHWINNDGKKVPFSTQQVWLDLRINIAKVHWYEVVWFKGYDSKHAFILWLAILKRLSTQDKMLKWMPNQDLKCAFCGVVADSISCVYHIWQERNNRIFKKVSRKVEGICNVIQDYVKCKLLTFKVKQSSAFREVEVVWDVKW
ncbi:uncharacterized protein [Rutidosis leptorrhynchoides]|uniref:uncharacterized protein n=1 Tax=Rutidosis leptorrhynchoides TaxID=125765 RepID=UPI003A990B37